MPQLSGLVAAGVDEALQDVLDRRLKEAIHQSQEKQHAEQMALQREQLAGVQQDREADNTRQSRMIDLAELKRKDDLSAAQTDRNVGLDAANVLNMPGMSKEAQANELMQSSLRNPNSSAAPGMMKIIEGLTKIPPKATPHFVTTPGPKGQPITREMSDAERETGVEEYVKPDKPTAPSLITIQTVDADGNPVTRIVPKTAGSEFLKPANATTANRVASARTVNELGTDMIGKLSDPALMAQLGPTMGRANTLRDWVGNPPPEFAELAGEIESYALANMGVHGMRSAQGSQMITKMMDEKQTPASLAAKIKGLNQFSERFAAENTPKSGAKTESVTPAVSHAPPAKKPTAAELIKKYGG